MILTVSDVSPMNSDVAVSVRTTLFVPKSKGVHCLMDSDTFVFTPGSNRYLNTIDILRFITHER